MIAILFFVFVLQRDVDVKTAVEQYYQMLFNVGFQLFQHAFFLVIYSAFLLIRYFARTFKRKGWRVGLQQFVFRFLLPITVLIVGVRAVMYTNSTEAFNFVWDYGVENTTGQSKDLYAQDGKHRGMTVFPRGGGFEEAVEVLIKDNIEWVAVVPFMYQETERTNQLNTSRITAQQWSRRDSSFIRQINTLHHKGIHVQLKPHVWMRDGWRSNITLSTEDWNTWFTSYRTHMLRYARMAQEYDVELLCVGTELRTAIQQKPEAWMQLIKDIQTVYTGKLTYAANWDDPIEAVPFWDAMDYIGIQAYFPLTEERSPELESIKKGWEQHMPKLEQAAQQYKRPILFTEIGYRSDDEATIKPWEWGSRFGTLSKKKSDITQQRAFEALFEQLWNKPWFAGCYVWQWHTSSTAERMKTNIDFTPRFKPAENTLTKWYGTPGRSVQTIWK